MLSLFEVLVGGFRILEGKYAVDYWSELSLNDRTIHGKKVSTTPSEDGPYRDKTKKDGGEING